ncbi:unnamed protein product [Pieris brassicae]|uniref:Uncharacterized protein n=1 Tax=Pieris brassicae TaxID=7116 RepID=A0A9P0T588_PIEBR|nr:unnamed protein product [Pieris brassicae]
MAIKSVMHTEHLYGYHGAVERLKTYSFLRQSKGNFEPVDCMADSLRLSLLNFSNWAIDRRERSRAAKLVSRGAAFETVPFCFYVCNEDS